MISILEYQFRLPLNDETRKYFLTTPEGNGHNYATENGEYGSLNTEWISEGDLIFERYGIVCNINGYIITKSNIPDGSEYYFFYPNGHFNPFLHSCLVGLCNNGIGGNIYARRQTADVETIYFYNQSGVTIPQGTTIHIFGTMLSIS